MTNHPTRQDRFRGLMIGTAVGDALGLPAEGISRQRVARLFKGPWRHRLLPGWGMISDDTEHTIFVAQALLAHSNNPERFMKRLGWSLRWWMLSVPAGIGLATLKAALKLWCGFGVHRSGVFSAGGGPVMRIAPIGALFAENTGAMLPFIEAATRITHTDPKALIGARAIAELAAWIIHDELNSRPEPDLLIDRLRRVAADEPEWNRLMDELRIACTEELSVEEFARRLGLEKGVTGYVYHLVPVVVHAWYRHFGDFPSALKAVLNCGGDTDTAGAIIGALAGATSGESGIPRHWITGIRDWPRNPGLCRRIADRLHQASMGDISAQQPVRYCWPALPLRNLTFLVIILLHGFRRLLPPY